jgi:hypothetical protein
MIIISKLQPITRHKFTYLRARFLDITNYLTESKKIGSVFVAIVVAIVTIKVIFFQLPTKSTLPIPVKTSPSCNTTTTKCIHEDGIEQSNAKNIKSFYIKHDYLFNNQYLAFLQNYRRPLIMLLGLIFPLILYIFNWYNQDVIHTMAPYFFLIGAQAGTMFVSANLLGPGSVTFVGLLYSSMRSLQLIGLYNKNIIRIDQANTMPKSEKNLLELLSFTLIFECFLWMLNSLYLLTFIVLVTEGLLGLHLSSSN